MNIRQLITPAGLALVLWIQPVLQADMQADSAVPPGRCFTGWEDMPRTRGPHEVTHPWRVDPAAQADSAEHPDRVKRADRTARGGKYLPTTTSTPHPVRPPTPTWLPTVLSLDDLLELFGIHVSVPWTPISP